MDEFLITYWSKIKITIGRDVIEDNEPAEYEMPNTMAEVVEQLLECGCQPYTTKIRVLHLCIEDGTIRDVTEDAIEAFVWGWMEVFDADTNLPQWAQDTYDRIGTMTAGDIAPDAPVTL